jgi:GntR family transcriptional regulator
MSVEAHQDHTTCGPLMSREIDRDNPIGYLYMQVAQHLARRIASGDLPTNRRLPAELQLAREYGVSLGTARHATKILREQGIVITVRSKGTFVVARPEAEAKGDSMEDQPHASRLSLIRQLDTLTPPLDDCPPQAPLSTPQHQPSETDSAAARWVPAQGGAADPGMASITG